MSSTHHFTPCFIFCLLGCSYPSTWICSSVATIQENLYDIRRFVTFYHDNITIIVRNGTVIAFMIESLSTKHAVTKM